jgi:hypothetical protein
MRLNDCGVWSYLTIGICVIAIILLYYYITVNMNSGQKRGSRRCQLDRSQSADTSPIRTSCSFRRIRINDPSGLLARNSRLARHPLSVRELCADAGKGRLELGGNYWKLSTRTMSLVKASSWV